MTRLAVWIAFGVSAAAWSTAPAQRADDYPAKPVRVIIPFAPGGPPDVIGRPLLQRLQAEVSRILKTPEMRSRIENAGLRPIGSTPEEFAAFIERDFAFFESVIREAKIHLVVPISRRCYGKRKAQAIPLTEYSSGVIFTRNLGS